MSELALKLIREAKEQGLKRLDLGKCGLITLPDQLFELIWLEELVLANEWFEYQSETQAWELKKSTNNGAWNQVETISNHISNLSKLRYLIATLPHSYATS